MLKESQSNKDVFSKIYDSMLISMPRVIITFTAGHPFELVKTRMQANPYIHSGVLLSKDIFQQTGIKGFYTGGLPNFSRAILKEAYRAPLRGGINYAFGQALPNSDKGTRAALTGISMAIADTIIICPLERIKVWLMTNQSTDKSFAKFFTNRSANNMPVYQDLFKGVTVSFTRSGVSWVSYLFAEAKIREIVMKASCSVNEYEPYPTLPIAERILIGALGGICNGLCTLPFDTIKTNVQKEGFIDRASLKTMCAVGKDLVVKHGFVKGLYPGFLTKLIHYSLVGIITSDVIQRVDKVWYDKISVKSS